MKTQVAARIALRYLLSRKSLSTVKTISAISVTGIAVASCALICVLSVFNGFTDFLQKGRSAIAPDIAVMPAQGKRLTSPETLTKSIAAIDGVRDVAEVVEDNALAISGDGRELPVKVTGTNTEKLRRNTDIEQCLRPGDKYITPQTDFTDDTIPDSTSEELTEESILAEFETPQSISSDQSIVSIGVAARLGVSPDTEQGITLYAPRRIGRVSIVNPAESFLSEPIELKGIFQTNDSHTDDASVIVDIRTARRLFQYDNECTRLDITLESASESARVADAIRRIAGADVTVLQSHEMQSEDLRMASIEKWITFLMLAFILLIASFNIISSVSMIILEKQENMRTLRCLGASGRDVGMIFRLESLYIILSGAVAGILLGIVLCLLQQHFGFIRLNGDSDTLIIKAYPVLLKWADIPVCLIPVFAVGIITAEISAAFARSRSRLH